MGAMTPDRESPAPHGGRPDGAEPQQERLDEVPAAPSMDGMVDQARALFDAAVDAFRSSLVLLHAEWRLAKSSASLLLMLAIALIVLAIGTWLALLALIAAGVHELVGNWFIGVGSVVLVNAIGVAWVVIAMRRCLRDMTMPRTRRMLSGLRPAATSATAAATNTESQR